jgi:hypothetical protein
MNNYLAAAIQMTAGSDKAANLELTPTDHRTT